MGCRKSTAVVHAAALVLGEEPGQDPIGFRLCRGVEGSTSDQQFVSSGGRDQEQRRPSARPERNRQCLATDALNRMLERAQRAEEWGYHRFWVAEHHAVHHASQPPTTRGGRTGGHAQQETRPRALARSRMEIRGGGGAILLEPLRARKNSAVDVVVLWPFSSFRT